MARSLRGIYLQSITTGGLPFHAALAEFGGRGVLFAAAGRTGKSTCSQRLPPPWTSWCDDEALVVRHPQQGYRVHPFPTWSDHLCRDLNTTWPAEHHVALSAIFFLEQAPDNALVPLGSGAAAARICEAARQVLLFQWRGMPPEKRAQSATQVLNNACALAKTVPAYRLRFSLEGRFWEQVETALEVTGDQV